MTRWLSNLFDRLLHWAINYGDDKRIDLSLVDFETGFNIPEEEREANRPLLYTPLCDPFPPISLLRRIPDTSEEADYRPTGAYIPPVISTRATASFSDPYDYLSASGIYCEASGTYYLWR